MQTFIQIFRKLILKLRELNAHTSTEGSDELMSQNDGAITGKTTPSAQRLRVAVSAPLYIPPSNSAGEFASSQPHKWGFGCD